MIKKKNVGVEVEVSIASVEVARILRKALAYAGADNQFHTKNWYYGDGLERAGMPIYVADSMSSGMVKSSVITLDSPTFEEVVEWTLKHSHANISFSGSTIGDDRRFCYWLGSRGKAISVTSSDTLVDAACLMLAEIVKKGEFALEV